MNTTTTTTTPSASPSASVGFVRGRSAFDWLFAALRARRRGAYAFSRYGAAMDGYEKAILVGAVPALIALGWFWGSLRALMLGVGGGRAAGDRAVQPAADGFGADLAQADKVFLLKYFLSSQSAILWMSVLFFMSTVFYWIGCSRRRAESDAAAAHRLAPGLGRRLHGADRHDGALVREPPDRRPTSATSRSATCTRCSCCSAG